MMKSKEFYEESISRLQKIRFDAVDDGDTLFWLHKKIGTPYLKM